ncbi:MAG TPA: DNA primase [Steroidobacteraceae bacterium]|jgi:DNA primase|nr:DNA primase [Steroidobacteraceae bacterium]
MTGRIPDSFLDELISRSDIVEIISARVPLKKAGREFKACCPFHNEKSPSFSVSAEKQFYHCFGCGAHGTVIGFLMQYEKMEFLDAVADLAQRAGLTLPREAQAPREPGSADLHELMLRAARFFEQNLADNARARSYVQRRGIDAKTCERFSLGYAPDSWDALLKRFGEQEDERRRLLQVGLILERSAEKTSGFYDRFRDRLMFPIRDGRGRVIGFGGRVIDQGEPKYMNSPETPLFHKGRELYGLYEARQARGDFKRLLIVEGYMDVVRLHQAGITYAVATLGTATTQEHLNKVFKITSEVVFCFDGDRAGRQAAWRALENALPLARDGRELKFMFLPEGHDPDTLIAEESPLAFEARMKDALPLSEYLVQQLIADVDLDHIDGRAKLKALAGPLFARMPEGIYREMLADRLATRVGIPANKLKESFAAGDGRREPNPPELRPKERGRMSVGRGNLLTQAIALLLHYPAAGAAIEEPGLLNSIDKPGVAVLRELLQQAAGSGTASTASTASTAMLLERWRDRPEFERLTELAMQDPLVADSAAAAKELKMAVEKLLQEYGPGRRMDELLRKAEELGLNYAEKAELSNLLKSKGSPRAPS